MAATNGIKPVAENRRARHDYHLLERYEAGLQLTGTEVKSLRNGRVSLAQSYADVRDGEIGSSAPTSTNTRRGTSPTTTPTATGSCSCTGARSTR